MHAVPPIIRRAFRGRSSTALICTSRCRRSPRPISSCRRHRKEAATWRTASSALEDAARADASGLALLRDAADSLRLSARGYHRVLRVARTLADLDGTERIGRLHLAEALSYRALAEDVRQMA